MGARRVGDAVVTIPLPYNKKQFVKIGSLLEFDNNDPNKGFPYMLMLDPWVDLGVLRAACDTASVQIPVSFYKSKQNADWPPPDKPASPRPKSEFDHASDDDDIPF
jgi:hypothetical protein